ncbi:MAG: stage II sporulation protein D [Clostridia bacterium]|nr:stage II sporulation protein D [Clostridia bacterium]
MRKTVYYMLAMMIAIILLPLLIVRGCGSKNVKKPDSEKDLSIKVYMHQTRTVEEMDFEEYLKGVVAAEMPASFETEALKAQAVAARTYAYGRLKKIYLPKNDTHMGADICTDPTHCQAWISKEAAMKKWGIFSSLKNWNKISKAVNETRGILIAYKGAIVNPVFHSNSGGRTENAEDVWGGGGVPYLRSVQSYGEELYSGFETVAEIPCKEFVSKLKAQYPDIILSEQNLKSQIKILDYTEGERVKNIKVGNITIKGTDFRKALSLKSANFKIEEGSKDMIKITTKGNGHGVGMSQWGANYLAKNGGTFEEILKYYYKGIEIFNIEEGQTARK